MNIFRGLLDLINGRPKPDVPQSSPGESAKLPVPVLEEILSVLRAAKPPSEARPPLPPVPAQIQPNQPSATPPENGKEDPAWVRFIERLMPKKADQSQGPPPIEPVSPQKKFTPDPVWFNPDGSPKPAASKPERPSSQPQTPPAPVPTRPPVQGPPPAPTVNVQPPSVTVAAPASTAAPAVTPAGNRSQDAGRSESVLSGFVAKLGQLVAAITGTIANLVAGLPKNLPGTMQGPSPSRGAFRSPTPPTGKGQETFGQQSKRNRGERLHIENLGKMSKGMGVIFKGAMKFGGAIGTAVGSLIDFGKRANQFAENVVLSNRELAMFSPKLMTANMNEAFAEFGRRQELADMTANSATRAQEARTKAKNAWTPLEGQLKSIKNEMSTLVSTASEGLARDAEMISEMIGIRSVVERIEGQGSASQETAGVQTLRNMAIPGPGFGHMWRPGGFSEVQPLDPIE